MNFQYYREKYSLDTVLELLGLPMVGGKFPAVWRNERTPSCIIKKNRPDTVGRFRERRIWRHFRPNKKRVEAFTNGGGGMA